MKKILSLAITAIFAAAAVGCSDYLDIKPRGFDVPFKLAHFEGLIYGVEPSTIFVYHYGTFEHTIDAPGYLSFFNTEGQKAAEAYKWSKDIFQRDDDCYEWNAPCSMFYTFNMVVNKVMDAEDGTDEQKRAVRAEARFLRAWYTYMMAQFFGKPYDPATAGTELCVPIITQASTLETDFTLRTSEDVYNYITTEMTEALPDLSVRPAHPCRVFYAAGNAMLGKVYWMMGEYGKAIPYLKAAKTALENDSRRGLTDLNEIIDREGGELVGYPLINSSPENVYKIVTMTNLWTSVSPMYGIAHRTLRTDIMEDYFEPGDCRLAFFTGVGSYATAYAGFDPQERYYTNMTNMTANEGISLPDVWLMYAESLAREGQDVEARKVLRELRMRRMDPSQADVPASVVSRDDLVRFAVGERIREHFGTGTNWYDMRRLWNDPLFQDMKQYYTRTDGTNMYTLSEERLTMEIPPAVMEWHPEYKQ